MNPVSAQSTPLASSLSTSPASNVATNAGANAASNDPLAALPPLALPEPISWWPPSPAWWALALAILVASTCLTITLRRYWLRHSQRRQLIAAIIDTLDAAKSEYEKRADTAHYLYQINTALQQASLWLDQTARAPFATGSDGNLQWLAQLNALSASPTIDAEIAAQLSLQYQPEPKINADQIDSAIAAWARGLRLTAFDIKRGKKPLHCSTTPIASTQGRQS